mmetsp:Transcript_10607/g.15896  ORF Transcript_10607/g.15896 Transcript_10607/m.15896 type:complete len:199 (-) Transcript_10607:14-610(-)
MDNDDSSVTVFEENSKITIPSNNPCVSHNAREVNHEAIWTLSSAKPLNGVEQLRDNNLETFWQSDGSFPHYVEILFQKKTTLCEISFYLNYKSDESYTPLKISIRAGYTQEDLKEIKSVDLKEPEGWINCQLRGQSEEEGEVPYLRARLLQVCINAMHQNGKDTHIRQCKVFSPRQAKLESNVPSFSTVEFRQFETVR